MIPEEVFHFMILAGAELVKRKSRYVNRERERERERERVIKCKQGPILGALKAIFFAFSRRE